MIRLTAAQEDLLREAARGNLIRARRGISRPLRTLADEGLLDLRVITTRYGTDYDVTLTDAGRAVLAAREEDL